MMTSTNEVKETTTCPHCGSQMRKMMLPDGTGYEAGYFFVCFNDECSYYMKGWNWMWERYRVKSSYRCRIDPHTGGTGPLPVWSNDALKDHIKA